MSASKSVTLRNAWEGSFLLIEDSADLEQLRLTVNEEGQLALFDADKDDLTEALTQLGIIGGEVERDEREQPDADRAELELFDAFAPARASLKPEWTAKGVLAAVNYIDGAPRAATYLTPADAERLARWILATLPQAVGVKR